jgi:regulator of nucleoside diphosphate kinase
MTVTDRDRCRLGHLLTSEQTAGFGSRILRTDLEMSLEEATTIPAELTPRWLVTMNSTVVLMDLASGEHETCTLVYPEDRDLVPDGVSVLQGLGQCLLGRCIGDIFEIPDHRRIRSFRIEALPFQPEAASKTYL